MLICQVAAVFHIGVKVVHYVLVAYMNGSVESGKENVDPAGLGGTLSVRQNPGINRVFKAEGTCGIKANIFLFREIHPEETSGFRRVGSLAGQEGYGQEEIYDMA